MLDPTGQWKAHLKQQVRKRLTPEQTQRLKKSVNEFREAALWGRDIAKSVGSSEPRTTNVYHACVQKTGSQWIAAVFRDQRMRQISGLEPFPQFRYEWGEFRREFPRYTFVPGLYISRQLYEEIEKPANYRTLYVIRDPRDVVVSWYYSMRDSHRLMGKVFEHRKNLRHLDFEDGLAYCIRNFHLKLSFMRSWAYAEGDPDTLFVRLEDLSSAPVQGFMEIMEHCRISIGRPELEEILASYTREKMRKRDLEVRDDPERSHYRSTPSDWREVFTERHRELFRDVTGDLVELLGYEWE
jgi:hypothetical protein